MLKNNAIRRIMISSLALFVLLILYSFPKNNNIKSETSYINSLKKPIYLIDSNDYVARVNILKNTDTVINNIKSIINSLTINNADDIYLPNGFKAIIPEKTKLKNVELKEGLLKINFSKELLNVTKEDEEKMLEAIIFSLTEIPDVKKIMIFVDDERLLKLPHSDNLLPLELDRSLGINKMYDLTSFKNVNKITTYYISKIDNYSYYVPVTSVVNDSTEKIQIIIKNLKTSPIYQTNLISYLASSANLENYEILENAINLSFNNNLITNMNNSSILEEVKYSMFLSLRDTYNVSAVVFDLPNQALSVMN